MRRCLQHWQGQQSGACANSLRSSSPPQHSKDGGRDFPCDVPACSRIGEKALFEALARAAERRMGDFIAQELANTAWAFATAGQLDALLFTALARAAEQRMGDFIAQQLANTAWAFATVGQAAASSFTALARTSEQCVDDFDAPDLAQTA